MPSEIAFEKKLYPRNSIAGDWKEIESGLWFSEKLAMYWKDGRHYDRLSASHNGLIGAGAKLKKVIKNDNI